MTKQELEKAIKNGESVWVANRYCYPYKVNLTNKHYVGVINDTKCLMLAFQNEDDELIDYLEYIFETKEKAQHYHDHANVSRTETLPFLTWEEFLEETRLKFIACDGVSNMILYCCNNTIYLVDEEYPEFNTTSWELTEENFYKAYDECVRLFRGGE